MRIKTASEYTLSKFEVSWYERLETITPGELRNLLDYNNAINQSADYKYRTIIKFITVLMGMNTDRQELAAKVIDKYWAKLDKDSLMINLSRYAPFEIFQKYFIKSRAPLSRWFFSGKIDISDKPMFEWVIVHKKFDKMLDEDFVEELADVAKQIPQWLIDLLSSKDTFVKIVSEKNYDDLMDSAVKELFVF